MNNTNLPLKSNKNKLPFPVPGKAICMDFEEKRFHTCDSKLFIRPALLIQASLPAQSDSLCIPCRDNCCLLLYVQEGRGQLENDAEIFDLSTGSGILAPADHPMYLKHDESSLSCVLLFLTGDLVWELYKVQNRSIICFDKYHIPDLWQRLDPMLDEYINAESPLLFDFSRHMDHLISRIIQYSLQSREYKEIERRQELMRVVTYMKDNCCHKIQVGDIAAAFGYSSSHFYRIFQAEFHQSPKKYLLGLRVAHAEKLLKTSDLSIEAIGQECGFNTTAHFIQTFREMNDVTPLRYRKQLAE